MMMMMIIVITIIITKEHQIDVFSPPARGSVIICVNSFVVVRQGAPTLHNKTSDVKSITSRTLPK